MGMQMNPTLAQWLPAIMMILAIWVVLIYNNKRLDDFKDLLRSEVGMTKSDLHAEIVEVTAASEKRILQAIAELRTDVQALDRRVQRLEAPLLRG